MFGDLFDEDMYFGSNDNGMNGNKTKSKPKDVDPPAHREFTNLSGIRNQGGTCYLNSLLQTLHFTPEFREALFSLGPEELGSLEDKDKPGAKVRIIPLQLQRLFAQLLLLDQQAASTTDLTDSFGWDSSEEMRQHDVQELNRILFSALETSLVGTSGHDLINRLYHGTVVNQIVCKECKNLSEKQEDFLDLTVAVKDVSGLEDALWNMYVEEEFFDCENLYHCGACDKLVKAVKSTKLRKLPPFLTISLLRFNFDFVKCERYKETSNYTFPLQLNLKPFCEQNELDDSEYTYDLFSVIIHKGGCYGGHYHVYIKDVDQLGNWQYQEEVAHENTLNSPVDQKEPKTCQEIDNPLIVLEAIILQEGCRLIQVDQLGQKILKKTGTSWNKKYRKQHGPIRKFLQSHSQIFLLSSDCSKVGLKKTHPSQQPKLDFEAHNLNSSQSSKGLQFPEAQAVGPLELEDGPCGTHWFDINDSSVQPIREKDIKKQFEGKESAYMLFYRKSQLQRPPEARSNPRYRVPCHLLNEMDTANIELQQKRADCDSAFNNIDLHLHLGSHYHFSNGALHPSSSRKESVLDLTIDRRKTLGDLRQSIFQILEFWEGDMVLSIAKSVPAGLHLFQTLYGDELSLRGIEIADGEDIFVWNGMEVSGEKIPTGEDCVPVLLTVFRPSENNGGGKVEQVTESQHVFPANADISSVCTALAFPAGSIWMNGAGSNVTELENWNVILKEDMKKTIRECGLKDGSSILLLRSNDCQESLVLEMDNLTAFICGSPWLQVKNLCNLECEKDPIKIPVTWEMLMLDIRIKAITELQLPEDLAGNSCLRPINRKGKLLPPVPDDFTIKDANLKLGNALGLCPGKAPTSTQLFLYFALGSDLQSGTEMEIIVEETISVKDCLKVMLEKSGLPGDTWHLRKMDWCYEAGEALSEENATLKDLELCTGDTLVLTEGKLPPMGFLKVLLWWYQPFTHSPQENVREQENGISCPTGTLKVTPAGDGPGVVQSEVSLRYIGDLEISQEASLEDLKIQALTLPSFLEVSIPSPLFLRAWKMERKHPGKLLRNNQQPLKEYKLGERVEVCVELLQKKENLGSRDLLLRVQMSIPHEREYSSPVDLAWDISKECTASSLTQQVANCYSLPVEKIEIAKYFPEKFEWMQINNWTQQVSKKKRKKKLENLQTAPYHLKDGDIIGVKNLLLDDDRDFSTTRDDMGKKKLQQLTLGKRKSRQAARLQNSDIFFDVREEPVRPHKPEAALSINVGVFR
ncbi:ubiquitin carboxyl-terminal hydrolase 40 isoform X1 [Ornithorhynchus anatinus]|uniref:Ubiquitin specific peptidase 40 n=1 Tax=Ornithorhynchus anatinus TaxID=9258 RepID=A0A6I8NZA2_ORNAN|nr:ubiquitin carboxyl-terminal hydrolase 40 isoform X1 [Ornithorhynchus anatinus]